MDITLGLTEALIGRREKTVLVSSGNLTDVSVVEGTYISSRRMYSSFLEVYSYLGLLKVKVVEQNKIQLSIAGQSGTYLRTEPYTFEQVSADGTAFEYNLKTIY